MQKTVYLILVLFICYASLPANAEESDAEYQQCLLDKLKTASAKTTVAALKAQCKKSEPVPIVKIAEDDKTVLPEPFFNKKRTEGAISKRVKEERQSQFNPYVITPHKKNYLLPVTYTTKMNREVYREVNDWSEDLSDTETKLQISFKVPLNTGDLFLENDSLFFGFTMKSWWQVYAQNISKPFRETNYQPEIFYSTPLNVSVGDTNSAFMVGIEHQSNGRSQPLSRSWNRVYLNWLFEYDNFALSFKPWYRLPEDRKPDPLNSDGDDNPDIDDFMGYFELGMAYQWDDYEFHMIGHQNFSTMRGGAQLGVTFPLWGKLRGYAQYFGGYGESMIDYNHSQHRIGIGFALTDLL
ncbi:MAG: phospholipase A [Gammaproteobacteria bacterium]|nr:phospholipase A [Gammaproteobacteria bacterium]NNJ71542.1 phospholipase A [Enterobacterales bacterium]